MSAQVGKTFIPKESGPVPEYTPAPPAKTAVSVENLPQLALKSRPKPAMGSPITVSTTGKNCIEKAISAAEEGATIVIPAGRYTECLTINKSLNFVAEGRVSIHSNGIGETMIINAPCVTFQGIAIKQKANRSRACVSVIGGYAQFTNCKVVSAAVAAVAVKGDGLVSMNKCLLIGDACPQLSMIGNAQVIAKGSIFSNTRTVGVTMKGKSAAMFTQCVFKDNLKGGISSIEQSVVHLDSCVFEECNIDIANESQENVVKGCTVTKSSGSAIVCAKSSMTYVYNTSITGGCVDSRDNASMELGSNSFVNASLICWGESKAKSTKDTFTGQSASSVAVSQSAFLEISEAKISDINGCGIVAYGGSTVTANSVAITNCGSSGIMTHSGSCIYIEGCQMQNCREFGFIAGDAREISMKSTVIKNCHKAGSEISRCETCGLTDVKILNNKKCGLVLTDTSITLEECEISDNSFSGIHMSAVGASITDCKFDKNGKGGMFLSNGSNIAASNLTFTECDWAAIYIDPESACEASGCSFNRNHIGIVAAGSCNLTESKFSANRGHAIQVMGKCEVAGSSFTGEKVAISVVGGSEFVMSESSLENNEVHIEVTEGSASNCVSCAFTGATGNCAAHVIESTSEFSSCTFENNNIAVVSEGNASISESVITGSKKTGIIFNSPADWDGASVNACRIEDNGECAISCIGGVCSIIGNIISGGETSKFGVYISEQAQPIIEENEFSGNSLANIWKGEE